MGPRFPPPRKYLVPSPLYSARGSRRSFPATRTSRWDRLLWRVDGFILKTALTRLGAAGSEAVLRNDDTLTSRDWRPMVTEGGRCANRKAIGEVRAGALSSQQLAARTMANGTTDKPVSKRIDAVEWRRKLDQAKSEAGGAEAHIFADADGVEYLVKATNNPQGGKVVVNDLIGGHRA
jgi:hypothetical protein